MGRMSLAAVLFASVVSGCSSTPVSPPENTAHWAVAIDQAANFYRLDNKLFRSQQLSAQDEPLLKQQGINTIINLRFFDRNDDQQAFAGKSLTLINTPLLSWAISPKEVAAVLWEIEKAQRQGAVLIHCYHGADRTGLIAAMYRVVYQNWSPAEAQREMVQGPYGFHSIWKNMHDFFTDQQVAAVKAELRLLKQNP